MRFLGKRLWPTCRCTVALACPGVILRDLRIFFTLHLTRRNTTYYIPGSPLSLPCLSQSLGNIICFVRLSQGVQPRRS